MNKQYIKSILTFIILIYFGDEYNCIVFATETENNNIKVDTNHTGNKLEESIVGNQ
ncbi:MAG TPA: hypothetical protein GXX59_11210 [Syntrophomonadaceae bacterium]|nr:hypothetical protein [Syntrophomonadaceae bacterium]